MGLLSPYTIGADPSLDDIYLYLLLQDEVPDRRVIVLAFML
jgi:hypothetical protein